MPSPLSSADPDSARQQHTTLVCLGEWLFAHVLAKRPQRKYHPRLGTLHALAKGWPNKNAQYDMHQKKKKKKRIPQKTLHPNTHVKQQQVTAGKEQHTVQIAYSFPNRHFPVHAFTVACCKRMTRNLPQIRARQGKVTFPHPRLQLVHIRDCYKNERLASPLCSPLFALLIRQGQPCTGRVHKFGCCYINCHRASA